MPVPKPRKGEKHSDYMKRVMPELSKNFPQDQAVAIAMNTYRSGRGKKKGARKTRRLRLRKSFAEQQAKAILAGVSIIAGQGNQGSLYFDKKSNTARVVYRQDRNLDMMDSWMSQVSEVLGIAKSRISVSPNAPKDWGKGSGWVHVAPDGSVETDPGLTVATDESPEEADEPEGGIEATRTLTRDDLSVPTEATAGEKPAADTSRKAARLEMAYDERILKVDDNQEYTFVLGAVMVPERFDNQGDIASAEVIERAAHGFIEESGRPGLMHKVRLTKREAAIVESYIVRSPGYAIGGTELPIGTWIVGMRVYDPRSRAAIKKGIFGGFSIGADADYNIIAG